MHADTQLVAGTLAVAQEVARITGQAIERMSGRGDYLGRPWTRAGRRARGLQITASELGETLQDHHQHPLLTRVDGGGEKPRTAGDVLEWAARLEADIATFIRLHLADDPPPSEVPLAGDARRWAEALHRSAQARQDALGRPALLRAV